MAFLFAFFTFGFLVPHEGGIVRRRKVRSINYQQMETGATGGEVFHASVKLILGGQASLNDQNGREFPVPDSKFKGHIPGFLAMGIGN